MGGRWKERESHDTWIYSSDSNRWDTRSKTALCEKPNQIKSSWVEIWEVKCILGSVCKSCLEIRRAGDPVNFYSPEVCACCMRLDYKDSRKYLPCAVATGIPMYCDVWSTRKFRFTWTRSVFISTTRGSGIENLRAVGNLLPFWGMTQRINVVQRFEIVSWSCFQIRVMFAMNEG